MMIEANESTVLPAIPLKDVVLFPHMVMPLVVGRPSSMAAVEAAIGSEDKSLVVLTQKDSSVEDPTLKDLYAVGSLAVIRKVARAENLLQIVVQGAKRVELVKAEQETPFLKVHVRYLPNPNDEGTEVEALQREVFEQVGQIQQVLPPQAQLAVAQILGQIKDPLEQTYTLANLLALDVENQQALLASPTREEAFRLMHGSLAHELQVLTLQHQIASKANSELSREQRELILRQQLQAIEEELGETSPEEAEVTELRKRLEQTDLPDAVRKEADKELASLARIPSASPDYQVKRTHVELILDLPWNKMTEDTLDLDHAAKVLDEDHFDLKEIKERIIEQLAVMKLNPEANAPILCFVGPPGVGKTSLGQSIARALGRKFNRMSLGGLHDEGELRGHRRTYIGAMPGRIIEAIRRAGVKNPLVMLDEIDKLGQDYRGDPAAALLEILDPAQNYQFHDNYLDLPFDLSKVFFITTANSLDGVPTPLLDRMEILRLSGYGDEEKKEIARRYLIARRIKEAGLPSDRLVIPEDTLTQIIRRYTREAGVRELERMLGRIARRIATRFVKGYTDAITIAVGDLGKLLGPERFFQEKARNRPAAGVATGLAWTETGGEVLYVEAVLLPGGSGGLTLTGHLGQVMQESARAAQSYIWSKSAELGIPEDRIGKSTAHIHVPAGAIPKDGPSAGITMAVVLASLYCGFPVRSDTAMTGEITLSGLVLPVGGVKEKVLAAHRAGVRRIILPKENEKDIEELPEPVRDQMEFVFAERIEDALTAAIPELGSRFSVTHVPLSHGATEQPPSSLVASPPRESR